MSSLYFASMKLPRNVLSIKLFELIESIKIPLILLTRKLLKDLLDEMRPQDRILRIKILRPMDIMNEHRLLVQEVKWPAVSKLEVYEARNIWTRAVRRLYKEGVLVVEVGVHQDERWQVIRSIAVKCKLLGYLTPGLPVQVPANLRHGCPGKNEGLLR